MRRLDLEALTEGAEAVLPTEIALAITRDELALLGNAVNETLAAVEDWEFHTRVGFTTAEARALRLHLGEYLRETEPPQ